MPLTQSDDPSPLGPPGYRPDLVIVIKLKLQKDRLGKRLHRNEVSHSLELCSVLTFVIVRGARSFSVFTVYNNANIYTRHLYFCLWE